MQDVQFDWIQLTVFVYSFIEYSLQYLYIVWLYTVYSICIQFDWIQYTVFVQDWIEYSFKHN